MFKRKTKPAEPKKPAFRITKDGAGGYNAEEKNIRFVPHIGIVCSYVVRSTHKTVDGAEKAILLLADEGTVIAEYDYPPLVRRDK